MCGQGDHDGRWVSRWGIGWWALWVALAAHVVMLVGLRVRMERGPSWLSGRALIWETRAQRVRVTGEETGRGALLRGGLPTETPVMEVFSTEMKRLVRRPGVMAIGGSVVLMREGGREGTEGGPGRRAARKLGWRCEAEDEGGKRMLGDWAEVEIPGDVGKYRPRGPVVVELVGGKGGELKHTAVKISSGDEGFDAAVVEAVGRARRKKVWGEETPLVPAIGEEVRGQVSVMIEPAE